jgi:hypothetical protein
MGSALPGRFLLDDSERRCESGERERERGMTGLERRMGPTKGVFVSCLRETTLCTIPRPPIYLVHLQSSTMTDAPVTEEKNPQTKPLDDDNDVDDSDEEGAPEIAAADG